MAVKILLTLLLLCVAFELGSQCQTKTNTVNGCDVVVNTSPCCKGKKLEHQCVCDFTCSEWDKPCNWVLTCKEEIENINNFRRAKNKLNVFRLPSRTQKECLQININTHKHPNCCDKFCAVYTDVCF
ncbi:uncharacterized protein [Drosophila kikkawai]|uniref:Uncharacterized protein n=1 Tax=Drosophila kikkawai TaxID=30033 RepID=A0A6P4J796_DROKI|nr:uncharacterized protein LOC108085345 [Drosophila kikkawai]